MKRYLSIAAVCSAILVCLPSSQSFDAQYLHLLTGDERAQLELKRLHFGVDGDISKLRDIAVRAGDDYWLMELASKDDVTSMLVLAERSTRESTRINWLARAANLGSAEGQFQLALESDSVNKRLSLLLSSAQAGHLPAQHALANWFIMNQSVDDALPWLEKTANHYPDDAFALAKYYWQMARVEEAKAYFLLAKDMGEQRAESYLQTVIEGPSTVDAIVSSKMVYTNIDRTPSDTKACAMNLLPVAKSLANQVQAQQMITQLQQDKRLSSLPICVSPPVWLEDSELTCEVKLRSGAQRMMCDLTQLEPIVTQHNVTHVIVFNPVGRAYVDMGAMYLDLNDTYAVFVHELAHFAGFADEYPMSEHLADIHCEQQTAPNLLFAGEIAYEPHTRAAEWQRIIELSDGKSLGIHSARTCNNVNRKAYKLTAARTFLEFHDSEYIPEVYRTLWREQLLAKRQWYPVSINIAHLYQERGMQSSASHWFNVAYNQSLQPAEQLQGVIDQNAEIAPK
ncbi:tetratricopeptide repeat protein [Alteromonas facilis]|uniref:tetratricopeptide repeat protein n=1 Tax=Alteromonas facilis TaxID=2048004 RepID=UPI000C290949|nr:hypothetical protein [Alteromonas facilis]